MNVKQGREMETNCLHRGRDSRALDSRHCNMDSFPGHGEEGEGELAG